MIAFGELLPLFDGTIWGRNPCSCRDTAREGTYEAKAPGDEMNDHGRHGAEHCQGKNRGRQVRQPGYAAGYRQTHSTSSPEKQRLHGLTPSRGRGRV